MRYREPKPTDQEEVDAAYKLFCAFILENPQVEPSLWIGVCLSAIADSFINAGMSYNYFKKCMLDGVLHYEKWWDEKI